MTSEPAAGSRVVDAEGYFNRSARNFPSREPTEAASGQFLGGILFSLAAPLVAFGVVATLAVRSRRPRELRVPRALGVEDGNRPVE